MITKGSVLRRIGSKRTYRYVEYIEGSRVYLRKPNGTPERIHIWDIGQRWEEVVLKGDDMIQ